MNNFNLAEEMDQAINGQIEQPLLHTHFDDPAACEMMEIAGELQTLPSPAFRAQLKANLLAEVAQEKAAFPVFTRLPRSKEIMERERREMEVLPSLFGNVSSSYFLNQRSFAASLLMHVSVLALVVSAGVWAARGDKTQASAHTTLIFPGDLILPAGMDPSHGGGGGGDRDPLPPSAGSPPRFSHQQLAPPTIVVRNTNPTLPVEATVVGPPEVKFPDRQIGDLLSASLASSNGPGSGGGIGTSLGTGDGPGRGPGVGDGRDGGIGGDVYQPGRGGVSAPRTIYDPEPEYSDEARRVKYEGNALLWLIVGADGLPHNIRVQRSLGMGLDEKAIEAVRQWKFQPATKDGRPVAVEIYVEVHFRLY